jgi:ketosteroid isomerase-like protein
VTLGNPFGPFARGRSAVEHRLERAASNYRDGELTGFEQVAKHETPELAYLVEFERYSAKVGGRDDLATVALRVTSIFRPEDDTWKVVHRHADPTGARLALVTERIARQVLEHEAELRSMLRLSLELAPPDQDALPLRQGRAIRWIEDALAPLKGRLPKGELRRLVLAIRATLGIEALVWLTDVGGLSRDQAADLMRSSAHTLLQAALSDAGITKNTA